jgi:heme-degrading monooxygenase HmoA
MIARLWQGRTATIEDADAYEEHLRTKVLPELRAIDGHEGAYVLRREVEDGVEFVTLTLFDSMGAIRTFAGDDPELANVSAEAREFLSGFDPKATHYEIVAEPDRVA